MGSRLTYGIGVAGTAIFAFPYFGVLPLHRTIALRNRSTAMRKIVASGFSGVDVMHDSSRWLQRCVVKTWRQGAQQGRELCHGRVDFRRGR